MARVLSYLLAACAVAVIAPTAVSANAGLPVLPNQSTSTTQTPSPTPKPAHGSLRLYLFGVFFVHKEALTVPRRGLTLGGVVRPYVQGQSVTVRAFVGHRLIKSVRLAVKPSRSHRYGRFSERLSTPVIGKVRIDVTHPRTSTQLGFSSHRSFTSLDRNIGFGSTGRFVQLVQQRLAALHFYVPQSGVYDQGTGLAIDAYHRLLTWGTSQNLDSKTISFLLNGWGQFKVRYRGHGRHAEGNLGIQLLALIKGSKVDMIFPISSGKPSTPTVLGNFSVYRRDPGYAPDGMYYSSYFYGGYAIHGFDPAPDYPASHGCMRLPIADAIPVYNWLNFGEGVDVYY